MLVSTRKMPVSTVECLLFAEGLPDPPKSLESLKKFYKMVEQDQRIRALLVKIVSPDCSCKKAEECVVCSQVVLRNLS